jgi:N-acetylglutamate synthase-like GNAT family acetyltransferase
MSSTQYTIRIARPDDFAGVDALLRVSYPVLMAPVYEADVLGPALELMARANPKLLACGTYYLAVADERILGCGGWTREYPGRTDVQRELAHLRHFATHPQWTQRGIGRAIYRQCEAAARIAGVRTLECHSSLNGQAFYTALGFLVIERFEIVLGPEVRLPSIHMGRQI